MRKENTIYIYKKARKVNKKQKMKLIAKAKVIEKKSVIFEWMKCFTQKIQVVKVN